MRFSLDTALLFFALAANTLAGPVNPKENHQVKLPLLKRATDGFHRSAVRHSAGLARDLRIAFRGLGRAHSTRAHLVGRGNTGSKPYCVSNPAGSPQQSNVSANSPAHSSPLSATVTKKGSPSSTQSPVTGPSSTAQSNFHVVQSYSGSTFFSGWDFFTGSDPTNGNVQFVDQQTAQSSNLTSISSAGNAIMRIDTTPQVSGNRNSVRVQTQFSFNGGLVIMDSVHMPTGCGTWPAFWMNGPTWPQTGEIDIVEGVNNYTNNQATLHTGTGCQMPSSNAAALNITGSVVGGTNCAALQTGNEGCGIRASQTNSFGAPFNNAGGGVYAMLWDNSGISIWFFSRGNIPSDITASAPVPEGWGTPMAFWPASTCNPYQFFQNQGVIFDTTLCGDWAGSVWTATGVPGQDQSCAQRTGVATCQQFVQQNGAALSEAYWEVKSVKIYQGNS
ncbi:concanavalin A-like lectin/glucanase domain-containing protein [Russula compacta]|nr:concanavalin A-like lectin/glucanase domain-containing protein [Russula compacta]